MGQRPPGRTTMTDWRSVRINRSVVEDFFIIHHSLSEESSLVHAPPPTIEQGILLSLLGPTLFDLSHHKLARQHEFQKYEFLGSVSGTMEKKKTNDTTLPKLFAATTAANNTVAKNMSLLQVIHTSAQAHTDSRVPLFSLSFLITDFGSSFGHWIILEWLSWTRLPFSRSISTTPTFYQPCTWFATRRGPNWSFGVSSVHEIPVTSRPSKRIPWHNFWEPFNDKASMPRANDWFWHFPLSFRSILPLEMYRWSMCRSTLIRYVNHFAQ